MTIIKRPSGIFKHDKTNWLLNILAEWWPTKLFDQRSNSIFNMRNWQNDENAETESEI